MILSDAEWLDMALEFGLPVEGARSGEYIIKTMRQRDSSVKYVVQNWSSVLSKKTHDWVYQPMPSSRTEKFLEKTRFDTRDEAYTAFLKWKAKYEKQNKGRINAE